MYALKIEYICCCFFNWQCVFFSIGGEILYSCQSAFCVDALSAAVPFSSVVLLSPVFDSFPAVLLSVG